MNDSLWKDFDKTFRPCLTDDGAIIPDYYVKIDGTILSTKRSKIKILTPYLNGGRDASNGRPASRYHMVCLTRDGGKQIGELVHRIVAKAWIGLPTADAKEINHIDGDKLNNHVDNLEWCSHSENMAHAVASGLMAKGDHRSRSLRSEVRAGIIAATGKGAAIAQTFGVAQSTIYRIRRTAKKAA
jgi:hypothetical protein